MPAMNESDPMAAENPMEIPDTLRALTVDIDTVTPYGRNPREGDVGAISESLREHGQYRPIVVNEPTGEILAGNHTWRAAKALGWDEIAVTFVSVDADQAARIVLVDNRTNDLATYDDQALADMLRELAETAGLDGTGFDGDALDQLMLDLDTAASFLPEESDGRSRLDVVDGSSRISCPNCAHEFSWSQRANR